LQVQNITKWGSYLNDDPKPIVISMFVFHVIGFVVSLLAMLDNVMNSTGWSAVGIFLVLTLGYAYFLFKK